MKVNKNLIKKLSTWAMIVGAIGFTLPILGALLLHWYGLVPGLIVSGSAWLIILGAVVGGTIS